MTILFLLYRIECNTAMSTLSFSFTQTKFIISAPKSAMVAWLVFCSLCLGSKMLSHMLEISQ